MGRTVAASSFFCFSWRSSTTRCRCLVMTRRRAFSFSRRSRRRARARARSSQKRAIRARQTTIISPSVDCTKSRPPTGDRGGEQDERPRGMEALVEEIAEDRPEGAARGDRGVPPRDAPHAELEQSGERRQQQQRAEPPPHHPLPRPPPQPPPSRDEQEERHQQAGEPEELEREGRRLRPERPDPVVRPGRVGRDVEERGIVRPVRAESEPQEHRDGEQQHADDLVALLGREGRPFRLRGRAGDGERQASYLPSPAISPPRGRAAMVEGLTGRRGLRYRMRDSGLSTGKV